MVLLSTHIRLPTLLAFIAIVCLVWQLRPSKSDYRGVFDGTHTHRSGNVNKFQHEASSKQEEALEDEAARTPRIAIITFVTDQRSYLHTVLKNKDSYARRHGYDFIVDYEEHGDRGLMWWKFAMIERLIATGKYDWIWWQDFDTLITNTAIKVTDIIEEELDSLQDRDNIDFLLTHDCNGLNAGSLIARGHERTLRMFRKAETVFDKFKEKDVNKSEQECVVEVLKEDPTAASSTHVAPQSKLNAFPEEIGCYAEPKTPWQPGMFFLHFAGAWAHLSMDDPTGHLMEKYSPQIVDHV